MPAQDNVLGLPHPPLEAVKGRPNPALNRRNNPNPTFMIHRTPNDAAPGTAISDNPWRMANSVLGPIAKSRLNGEESPV